MGYTTLMTDNLKQELQRVVAILKSQYQPMKIIIFGSTARKDRATADSDLDLVVVKQTNKRFYDRIGEVLRLIKPRESIDILVYTPDEYTRLSRESWFVGEEIAKKGKVIYAVS